MRASGILLPIFSLPGKYGIGCFSKEAYNFIDFLANAKQKYWQILPLGPTSYGDSPYQSFSTFAGNPYFIDPQALVDKGLLEAKDLKGLDFGKDDRDIDYSLLYENRFKLLRKAYENSNINKSSDFNRFRSENQYWLHDYALFMAIKDFFGGGCYTQWPEDIRRHYGYAIEYYQDKLYYDVEFYEFLQYEFFTEWFKLKSYANEKGIKIIGDIPIYVSADSSDAWAHPELFQVDDQGNPTAVAGCPPDGFSPTGQLWGNPLYNWEYHRKTGFDWWVKRVSKCRQLYDVIRIDHFRGFDEYYSIPAGDKDAKGGSWKKGPGIDLFRTINYHLPGTEIIAEDLGYITDTVRWLVSECGYPNMKVLQFAFDSRDSSGPIEYLPYNYNKNCVVYTGTHDNETVRGYLDSIKPAELNMIRKYIGNDALTKEELVKELIRLAQASTGNLCVIPMQDYLGLDNKARINTPSTLGTNWRWRFKKTDFTKALRDEIKSFTVTYGRA